MQWHSGVLNCWNSSFVADTGLVSRAHLKISYYLVGRVISENLIGLFRTDVTVALAFIVRMRDDKSGRGMTSEVVVVVM